MNKVILIGNLGKDAELHTTPTGKKYVKLSVATSVSWNDKATAEKKEKTEWHRITVWGDGFADFLGNNAKKGGKVLVEGQLSTSKYQDKAGQDRWSTDIVVQGYGSTVRLLNRPGETTGNAPPPPADAPDPGRWDDYNDGAFPL